MTDLEEVWKPIPGWPYMASNLGRIKRSDNGRIMSHAPLDRGHLVVCLTRDKEHKNKYVHRLVMSAFHGDSRQLVRHLDGNPTNNNLQNLCYGTVKENSDDRLLHGTDFCGEKCPFAKLCDDDVKWIRDFHRTHVLSRKLSGHKKAKVGVVGLMAISLNVSVANVEAVLSGRTWTLTKGYY